MYTTEEGEKRIKNNNKQTQRQYIYRTLLKNLKLNMTIINFDVFLWTRQQLIEIKGEFRVYYYFRQFWSLQNALLFD